MALSYDAPLAIEDDDDTGGVVAHTTLGDVILLTSVIVVAGMALLIILIMVCPDEGDPDPDENSATDATDDGYDTDASSVDSIDMDMDTHKAKHVYRVVPRCIDRPWTCRDCGVRIGADALDNNVHYVCIQQMCGFELCHRCLDPMVQVGH